MSVGSDDSTRRVGAEISGKFTLHNGSNPSTDIALTARNTGGFNCISVCALTADTVFVTFYCWSYINSRNI